MKILNFKNFVKKYNLKKTTMDESELRRDHKNPIYPGDSKLYSDKGFVIIHNGTQGGSHWTYFQIKDNKS